MSSVLMAVGTIGGLLYLGNYIFQKGRASAFKEAAKDLDKVIESLDNILKDDPENQEDSKEGEA